MVKRPSLKPRPDDRDESLPADGAKTAPTPGKARAGWRRAGSTAPTPPAARQTPSREASDAEPYSPASTLLARFVTLLTVGFTVFLVVFSPLRSWMHQQEQSRELAARISQVKAQNEALEQEIERYQDPDYIARQARERLGYVRPGEITYIVVDPPGASTPPHSKGWMGKDTNDLPWFAQVVEGIKTASIPPAPVASKKN